MIMSWLLWYKAMIQMKISYIYTIFYKKSFYIYYKAITMKISETSWWKFAIVEWIECRLTTKNVKNNIQLLDGIVYEISNWIYYNTKWFALWWETILIPSKVEKIESKMKKLWYKDFDYDSKTYALVKCYK